MGERVRRAARLTALAGAVGAVGLLALAGGSAAAAPVPSGSGTPAAVSLVGGGALPGGTYTVTIRVNGHVRTARIVVPTSTEPGGPSTTTPRPTGSAPPSSAAPSAVPSTDSAAGGTPGPDGSGHLGLIAVAVLGVALTGLLAYLGYLRILVPRRRRLSYRSAVDALAGGQYSRALDELESLQATLPPEQRDEARFFIGFAHFQLDDLAKAELWLAPLHRERRSDLDVGYLLAYLRARRRDFEQAANVLSALPPAMLRADARLRKLYGVVQFHRGVEAFHDGRLDEAADWFGIVQELGDFREQIPLDLRSRHIVLGTQALFDKRAVEARGHFEQLEQVAPRMDPPLRAELLAVANLGLALAMWIENAPRNEEIDTRLTEAATLLDPDGPLSLPWPAEPTDLAGRLAQLDQATQPPAPGAADRVLRDIHLLRAATVLRAWAAAVPVRAEAARGRFLEQVLNRLGCVRARDAEFSDPYLIVGLLRYRLAGDEDERQVAVATLAEAQRLGSHEPDVVRALEEDKRARRATKDAVDAYLQMLDRYVNDRTVREQVRNDLLERMSRYGRVRELDNRPGVIRIRVAQPTVAEMNDRSQLLTERVRQLLARYPEAADLSGADELVRDLELTGRALSEHARAVEENEARLLAMLGDRLLPAT